MVIRRRAAGPRRSVSLVRVVRALLAAAWAARPNLWEVSPTPISLRSGCWFELLEGDSASETPPAVESFSAAEFCLRIGDWLLARPCTTPWDRSTNRRFCPRLAGMERQSIRPARVFYPSGLAVLRRLERRRCCPSPVGFPDGPRSGSEFGVWTVRRAGWAHGGPRPGTAAATRRPGPGSRRRSSGR